MALPTIACCYRDCGVQVWSPVSGHLEVHCSSATCMTCRRVALCLRHFEDVRAQQGNLGCPNCGGRRWHVVLFEPVKLPAALETEVSAERGHIEVRFVSTGTTSDTPQAEPAPAPRASEPPPPPPAPAEWRLVRASELAPGVRAVEPGLAFRAEGDGATVVLDDDLEAAVAVDGIVRRAVRSGRCVLVETAASAQTVSSVEWLMPDGRRGHLPNPFQLSVRGPAFVSHDRFVVVLDLPDGRSELREGRFDEPGLVRTRRIGRAMRLADDGAAPAVLGGHSGVIFGRDSEGYVPTCVRLDDGRETTIGAAQAPPRVVVAAPDVPLAAWVNYDGDVRCGGPGSEERMLGSCDTDMLAMSDDGRRVAWVDGPLHVADTQTGQVSIWKIPDDVVAVGWAAAAPV